MTESLSMVSRSKRQWPVFKKGDGDDSGAGESVSRRVGPDMCGEGEGLCFHPEWEGLRS